MAKKEIVASSTSRDYSTSAFGSASQNRGLHFAGSMNTLNSGAIGERR
jgi:hypothetical protein